MKNLGIILSCILIAASQAGAVVVTTTAELVSAVNTSQSEIILNAPLFELSAFMYVDHDCTFAPHPDRSGNGGVTIDGMNTYNVRFQNATLQVGVDDPNNVLTFTHGYNGTVMISSLTKDTQATFDYCNFNNSFSINGLSVLTGQYDLDVICNNCRADNNQNDGFNQHNQYATGPFGESILTLNNCYATGNDRNHVGGAAGDAISPHDDNETVIIHGGAYYDNGKSGIGAQDGSKVYIDGGTVFYGNGYIQNNGDILIITGSYLEIDGAEFSGLHAVNAPNVRIRSNGSMKIKNCTFKDPVTTGGYFVKVDTNASGTMENCIFENGDSSQVAVELDGASSAEVKNCTFYNNYKNVEIKNMSASNVTIKNSIFEAAISSAVVGGYNTNPNNGYNCFYNNAVNISGGSLLATDIAADPQFADKVNGDFHVKSENGCWNPTTTQWVKDATTSPCVDGANPADLCTEELWPHGLRVNIGAYGNTNQASISLSTVGSTADSEPDGDVDIADFYEVINKWLDTVILDKADFNHDNIISLPDFAVFANNIDSDWAWLEFCPPFLESAGLFVAEAEHYCKNVPGSGDGDGYNWQLLDDEPNTTAEGYMQSIPLGRKKIETNVEQDSPHMFYTVDFQTTGTYYLWLRGRATSSTYSHVHFGLDNNCLTSTLNNALKLNVDPYFTWASQTGDGSRPTITVNSTGKHNIDIWMYQAGTMIDRVLLTTNPAYVPIDPPESPK